MNITTTVPAVPTNRVEAAELYAAALAFTERYVGRNDRAMIANDYCSWGVRQGITIEEFVATYYPNTQLRK